MPEGDTIHRSASALRTALAGKPMLRFDAPCLVGPAPRAGRVVERVESHGKHIEIVWDDNMVLHTHMRMSGEWHLYRQGDRWRRPHDQLRVAIEVPDWVAVCFSAPTVETYRVADRRRHPGMGRLGPDLCASEIDIEEVANLLLSHPDPDARIGEVLLDQRVMCGIGNVYRCEVLFAVEMSPFARVGALSQSDAIGLADSAVSLLRANLRSPHRVTAPNTRSGRAVYGRNGQRCPRCGETIQSRPMGVHHRILYWCPGCQFHLDPRQKSSADDTPADPHPAAQQFLADLPWNRDAS
ncbi:MAG: DNA-formamidopyrimidine glycosylase family protein [Acidimicrobiia bacterium]|nr:DNA-formamidopyrimidine glycosylase family protein [Acidimicrobiia bacterium]